MGLQKSLLIFGIFTYFSIPQCAANPQCIGTEKCSCIPNGPEHYEYQCPPNKFQTHWDTKLDQFVEMYCEKLQSFDIDKFPDIHNENAEYFSMSYCPLPEFSFNTIFKKFSMNHVKKLVFYYSSVQNLTLRKNVLEGLTDLESLKITYNTLTVENDFLANTPNMSQLILSNNAIKEINSELFKYTPKIRHLDLAQNQIEKIPNNVFENLKDLQNLNLWSNNLTYLNKQMFEGPKNLRLLELSINKISSLTEDVFSNFKYLVQLSLKKNNLGYIPGNIFQNCVHLESIRLGNNPNLRLSDYLFSNLSSLQIINIDESNLAELPENIFEGSVNLHEISLIGNQLEYLPETLFKNLTKLNMVDLSRNKLKYLPDKLFSSLNNLTKLNLQHNMLEILYDNTFRYLSNLESLNLENNKIIAIGSNTFNSLEKLKILNLAKNRWNYSVPIGLSNIPWSPILEHYYSPMSACSNLEDINLNFNMLKKLPAELIQSKVNLKTLSLVSNLISTISITDFFGVSQHNVEVDLSKNNITEIDLSFVEEIIQSNSNAESDDLYKTEIILGQSNILCDCSIYDLVKYNNRLLHPNVYKTFDIRQKKFYCSNFNMTPVESLKPENVSCAVESKMGCPKSCDCKWRPYYKSVDIDCSYKNLTSVPVIPSDVGHAYVYNQTVVNLEGNYLHFGPTDGFGYNNVTQLNLARNLLNNFTWVPPNIKVLQLDNNNIELLDKDIIDVLKNMSSLEALTLSKNPWKCDCSAIDLQYFLLNCYNKVDSSGVICVDTMKPLVNVKDICQLPTALIASMTIILVFVLVVVTMLALYYRYEREIKIYLYAKNIFLWFVSEDDIDKDKIYDVFICYSHKDEGFVVKDLLPELESGPNPFKTCVHVRDWVPGESITTQVIQSVQDSKRTLVVLSNNFMESEWGKMEFREAHSQAMKDGRARVIVVIYGDLDEDALDDELKAYFKTNTYVKWGDPWFWKKLRYALPHSKRGFYNQNKKQNDVMLKIDDRFKFVQTDNDSTNSTTPPVSVENIEIAIPEGESPLLKR